MDSLIKILVVEDEMFIGAKISMLLTNMGYEVKSVLPRGEDAILHVKEKCGLFLFQTFECPKNYGTRIVLLSSRETVSPFYQ